MRKKISLMAVVIFIISLVPVFMLAGINQATGDDLGYGVATHMAWLETGSLFAVIRAAAETVTGIYKSWQGTWFTVFLFTLQPEVFSPDAYVIVPFLMLFLWIGVTGLSLHYIFVKIGKMDKFACLTLITVFMFIGMHFVISTKSAIFWYNGIIHYMIPYEIALLGVYFALRFIWEEKNRFYVATVLCLILLGGGNYQAALFAPMLIGLITLFYIKKNKKVCRLFGALILEIPGLIISMKAPGNKGRGGEDFGFSISKAVNTVLQCFIQGFCEIGNYIKEKPIVFLLFIIIAIVVWNEFREGKLAGNYKYPLLFITLSFCVYCAMYAPQIYAGVEVSGGVFNMNFHVFALMLLADIVYIEGWIGNRLQKIQPVDKRFLAGLAVMSMMVLILCRGTVKDTTFFKCIDYIRSGQAADFKSQMVLQKKWLLDEEKKEVILPEINDDQGPLMHMPLTQDENAWTNTITKDFYGKTKVIAIPRNEWMQQYGETYE